jgi:hypothetical protein
MRNKIPPIDLLAQLPPGHELENGTGAVLLVLCGLLVFATYNLIQSVVNLLLRSFILLATVGALVAAGVRILN